MAVRIDMSCLPLKGKGYYTKFPNLYSLEWATKARRKNFLMAAYKLLPILKFFILIYLIE
jgi:hypothetical protein